MIARQERRTANRSILTDVKSVALLQKLTQNWATPHTVPPAPPTRDSAPQCLPQSRQEMPPALLPRCCPPFLPIQPSARQAVRRGCETTAPLLSAAALGSQQSLALTAQQQGNHRSVKFTVVTINKARAERISPPRPAGLYLPCSQFQASESLSYFTIQLMRIVKYFHISR